MSLVQENSTKFFLTRLRCDFFYYQTVPYLLIAKVVVCSAGGYS